MYMIRCMNGLTLKDRFRNERIRGNLKISPLDNKIRETRLRWFGNISRKPNTTPVHRVERLLIEGIRRRGRPLKI